MKTQIDSILIPTDFSNLAESALKVGLAIAKRQNAKIILLHVIDRYAYLQANEVYISDVSVGKEIKSTIASRLNNLAGKIKTLMGIDISGVVLEGSPSDTICRIAIENKISLIVMGTHGTSGIREFFMGSESFRVIKNAVCPVLTIPGNWRKTYFEKVLFPVRFSPGNLDKYFFARPIIEKNNSEVMVLGLTDPDRPDDLKEVDSLMEKLKKQLKTDRVHFNSMLTASKDFPTSIIDNSIEFEADLIVLSANLDYTVKNFFLGQFAQQVVNHSHLPVLSIRPSGTADFDHLSSAPSPDWGNSVILPEL